MGGRLAGEVTAGCGARPICLGTKARRSVSGGAPADALASSGGSICGETYGDNGGGAHAVVTTQKTT